MSGHKPGPFNAPNKKHKTGGHRSKGQIDRQSRGRLGAGSGSSASVRSISLRRQDRKSALDQQRKVKRMAAVDAKRAIGGSDQAPILVTIISFDVTAPGKSLLSTLQVKTSSNEDNYKWSSYETLSHLASKSHKRRFTFVTPDTCDDIYSSVMASDVVLFFWPLGDAVEALRDSAYYEVFTTLINLGMPAALHYMNTPSTNPSFEKLKKQKIELQKFFKKVSVPCDDLFRFDLSNVDELFRKIAECKKTPTAIQGSRGYLLAETAVLSEATGEQGIGELQLTGHMRGRGFPVNGVIHVPGCGDFVMSRMEILRDDFAIKNSKRKEGEMEEGHGSVVSVVTPKYNPFEDQPAEVRPDAMEGEQNVEEFAPLASIEAEERKKKVRKGTSAYQAAWLDDDEDDTAYGISFSEDDTNSEEDEAESDGMDDEVFDDGKDNEKKVSFADCDDADDIEMDDDSQLDFDDDAAKLFHEARVDAEFPDEIDTPLDVPARDRFQKYRAVPSFKTSRWDPKENLPYDYSRIYKMKNYKQCRKTALNFRDLTDEVFYPGSYVRIHLANFPLHFANKFKASVPVLAFHVLPFEHCMTVMNMKVEKYGHEMIPIKNKERLVFRVGYRMFAAEALFSENSNGDKFKMERFMPDKGFFCMSVFAPVLFGPVPVFVYKENNQGELRLCAKGVTLNPSPDRVILKRVVLAGHPYRVKGRFAVVRYMFYNPGDVEWFKPVELYTPTGCRGHITESLGTHGLFKARFDRQLAADNTVLLSLYKRVFPKWSFEANLNVRSRSLVEVNAGDDRMEVCG